MEMTLVKEFIKGLGWGAFFALGLLGAVALLVGSLHVIVSCIDVISKL